MTRDGETYYYHTNARGDVVAMSDSSGAVVNTYAYDPWGTLLASSETVANPYRYASYRYDTATGLYYCWNRYYAPELARFLTRDIYPGELSDPVTMNPYLYCGGDPVNRVDPTGMYSAEVLAYSIEGGVQYGLDTGVLLFTGCSAAFLVVGFGTGNPGLVLASQVVRLMASGLDAVADSYWDANTGGCRSEANAETAAWTAGKYSGGIPDPLTSAMFDTFRAGYSLPGAYARLQEDADYYFDFSHLKERIAQ
jgi:RHS repeat-associated protein